MRSPLVTFALAVVALLLAALAALSLSEGGLDRLLQGKPLAQGQPLYRFDPAAVHRIVLTGTGVAARFVRRNGEWQATDPWRDRMDPRLAARLIDFTLNARVEDTIDRDDVDLRLVGLGTGSTIVRLRDAEGELLAHFMLGRRTAWHVEQATGGTPLPTVFVRPLDPGRGDHLYACTGDPLPIFRDGLRRLRDHRPFRFRPDDLTAVRIRTGEGELRLARNHPGDAWRIAKPLELPTEADAVQRLVEGLAELTATRVADPGGIVPPATDAAAADAIEIGVEQPGQAGEVTLRITPSADPAAVTAMATVSNRQAVFELPLRPGPADVALLELPLSVNDLRDKTLARLNGPDLQAILIAPADGPPISLARAPRQPWQLTGQGDAREVDHRSLVRLIEAVTRTTVAGFVTDTATDFSPYGLNQPLLTLRFRAFSGDTLELRFGRGPDGTLHANRTGSPTVVKVDEELLGRIATRPHQWKAPRVWDLAAVDVVGIERRLPGAGPELLSYSYLDETWRATRGGRDVTAELNPNRADFLLSALERLQVVRWLGSGDAAAATALLEPALTIRVLQRRTDDAGDTTAMAGRELLVTPVSDSPANRFHYALVAGNPDFFILDAETVGMLTVPLFEEE